VPDTPIEERSKLLARVAEIRDRASSMFDVNVRQVLLRLAQRLENDANRKSQTIALASGFLDWVLSSSLFEHSQSTHGKG